METSTRIPVPGTYNFRDVGGLPAKTGTVRDGVLYRSDGLHRLGVDGRAALRDLGIGIVIDLRDENEAAVMPDDLDGLDVEVLRLPVFEGSGASQGRGGISLDALYDRIVTQHAPIVVSALREISSAGERSVVVHCTAGKDRTGWAAALLLHLAGVDDETILEDYLLTNTFSSATRGKYLGLVREHLGADKVEVYERVMVADETYLQTAYDSVTAAYGDRLGYLRDGLGLNDATLERLRARMLA